MIYKKGRYYMAKFRWEKELIRKSTRCTNAKDARAVEGTVRSELAKGNFGILHAKPRLTLDDFLTHDFKPFIKAEHKSKPHTLDYYQQGIKKLQASQLASLRLDEITSQHVNAYIAQHGHFEESTINRDLRALRRALSLAVEWGKLDRKPKVTLAKGENKRERVLTDREAENYLAGCPQLWRDVVTVLLGTGMRPGEAYALDWRNILLNGSTGLIQITQGKTKATRRLLPMVPTVYKVLKARQEAQGCRASGWVFPTGSASGHIERSSAKQWHAKALANHEEARKKNPDLPEIDHFEPYCLRHTALTRLADAGCDAFTLARIAGHSSIRVTERYVHPQAEAIDLAFKKLVTDGGHPELSPTSR